MEECCEAASCICPLQQWWTDGYISATNVVLSCFGNLQVNGGSLIVTNATHDATLNMGGTFTLNGGTLQVDKLVMTNSCISFIHDGGTVIAGSVVLDPNAFRITSITQQGNDLNITWLMGPGQTNTLQVINGRWARWVSHEWVHGYICGDEQSRRGNRDELFGCLVAQPMFPRATYRARLVP